MMWLVCLLILSIFCSCFVGSVNVTIADLRKKEDVNHSRYHTKDITFHGSHIHGIALHISNRSDEEDHWTITAPLAYAFPNQGQGARIHGLVNEVEVEGKIVLFDLPNVDSPFEYVLASAQEHKAIGCIIIVAPNNNAKQTAIDIAVKAEKDRSIRQGYHPQFDLLEEIQKFPTVVVDWDGGERLKNR